MLVHHQLNVTAEFDLVIFPLCDHELERDAPLEKILLVVLSSREHPHNEGFKFCLHFYNHLISDLCQRKPALAYFDKSLSEQASRRIEHPNI